MSTTPSWVPEWEDLAAADPEIAEIADREAARLAAGLQLIASENHASPAVRAALASPLSMKYAEGFVGQRFYPGCEHVDRAEELAVQRARNLFGAEHANVQSHSGTSANLAVYAAFAKPDDPVMALSLAHGGHLTHGARISFSGAWFTPVPYEVDQASERIDYEAVREIARIHAPRIIVCGGTSYPRNIDYQVFREIADEIEAILWVDAAHIMGLVAGGAVPDPVPFADVVTTTTHKTLRGPRGGMILCRNEHARAIDRAVFPFSQSGPAMHAIAAKAVALREASLPAFTDYARGMVENAQALAEALAGHGARIVTGGTDTHMVVADLQPLGVDGARAEELCASAGIYLNKSAIPFDPLPPRAPSGIRVGTAALTTQGFGPADMAEVAGLIARACRGEDPGRIAADVAGLVARYPAFPAGHAEPGGRDRGSRIRRGGSSA
ncbi:serine hydroxymethyltransferase [Lolliginicoccus suaedae]|uniref:serine hydroxymethyltransferase n=1 Tax=Lolliginicoccus suaedae TaxID=2605429 RepID=UPI0011EFADB1|nr:serine hydroxymethyltransferase [Lolliginicoccus suaedae]